MKILIRKTAEQAAFQVALSITTRLAEHPDTVMALATGNTTKPVYRQVVELWNRTGMEASSAIGLAVDEYALIAADDPIGCRKRLHDTLVAGHVLRADRLHGPEETDIHQYDRLIESYGGIDLQVLGVGRNGHLGFNEPGTSMNSRVHTVTLTDATRDVLAEKYGKKDRTGIPEQGITMGMKDIMQSRTIILLITGTAKSRIAKELIEGPVTKRVPASLLQLHPCCTVVMDETAAYLLE